MCKHNDGQLCGAPTPTPTSAPGDPSAARTRLQLWLVLAVAFVIACCCGFGLILVLVCNKKKKTPLTEKLKAALEVDAVQVLMLDGPDCEEVSKDDAAPYRFAAPPTAEQLPQSMIAVSVCGCGSPDELDRPNTSEA